MPKEAADSQRAHHTAARGTIQSSVGQCQPIGGAVERESEKIRANYVRIPEDS